MSELDDGVNLILDYLDSVEADVPFDVYTTLRNMVGSLASVQSPVTIEQMDAAAVRCTYNGHKINTTVGCVVNSETNVASFFYRDFVRVLLEQTGITGCACGEDHVTVPIENGVELVCRVHKRHIPCRRCEED